MLCERCKNKPAIMRLVKVVNNKKYVINLCAECAAAAEQQHIKPMIDGVGSILSGLMKLDNIWEHEPEKNGAEKCCPVCKSTAAEINRVGKLGCAECYNTFLNELRPLLRKIHGNCLHKGAKPKLSAAEESAALAGSTSEEALEALKLQMQLAVRDEDFEKAAELRDQIRAAEKE